MRALLKAGAKKIYVGARKLDGIKGLIAEAPDKLHPIEIDVTNKDQIAAAARAAKDVTLLVNNAGINFNTPLFAIESTDNARREMEVNYFGTLAMCRAFQPILKANGGGAIVNMLSILSHVNLPLMGSLCASKAALYSLTQALRAELKAQGTHVDGRAARRGRHRHDGGRERAEDPAALCRRRHHRRPRSAAPTRSIRATWRPACSMA